MRKAISVFIAVLSMLSLRTPAHPQNPAPTPTPTPSISAKDLEKHTYHFNVNGGALTGDGAKFLAEQFAVSQYVLLGEYHGSKRISEFTKAIIPTLHEAGFRHFGLEIGPVSAAILKELSLDPRRTIGNLEKFNSKYLVSRRDRVFTPIPFFSYIEDAEFLNEAAKRRWSLLGLDQEFSFSYFPLLDRINRNLRPEKRAEVKAKYDAARKELEAIYRDDAARTRNAYIAISESAAINSYLDAASEGNAGNQAIADSLRVTTDIYKNNAPTIRKYYLANDTRIGYMKKNLARSFSRVRFDLKRDRMLLKMGAVHTGRGFSPLSLFEIGNTLSELAEFHGNRSLHIYFSSRYYTDGEREVDALSDTAGFGYRFKALLQMGKRDTWTVIDLRPLHEGVFYHRRFEVDDVVREIWKNQDIVIIPPIDADPTPNYTKD